MFLFLLFLPTIASLRVCKPLFNRALSAQIGSLHFSWLGPQTFRTIEWNLDPFKASAEELEIQAPFWNFSGPFVLKEGTINYNESRIVQIEGDLHGRLFKNELKLLAPLQASIHIDAETSSFLFQQSNPLLLKGIQTKNPILIQMDPSFFSLPRPFSLAACKLQGNFNAGLLVCENGKTLASFVALATGAQSLVREMNGQFSSAEFQLDQGMLKIGRIDALFDRAIHVCTWGEINLLSEQLQMNIGLCADTLQNSFGIQNLDPNYVLKIPVQGSLSDPEIVKGPAFAQLAALIAAKKLSKKTVFGKVADLFSRPRLDPDIPPAKHPFPWEG